MSEIYDIECTTAQGEEQRLDAYRDKAMLIVNTASRCGFTPQFAGLEKLHREFAGRGLQVLGFPCNQFGKQDPGSDGEILDFCQKNYGVSFPIFSKVEVNGKNAHPLYRLLKKAVPGLLGSEAIKWNFTKFLVNRDGKVVARFAPSDKPEQLEQAIEELL